MEQLSLDIDWRRDPFTCPHAVGIGWGGRVMCDLRGYKAHESGEIDAKTVYTNCRHSIAGDKPKCVYEPCDNSPEAMARRREWMKENDTKSA